jgi:hypothetical protein
VSTNQQRDADVDRLLRAVLKPAAPAQAGECPDAGMLAAFIEGTLSKGEQSALDAHIVQCGRCQEALAIIGREAPGPAPAVAPERSRWFTWVTRPRLRWLVPVTAFATIAVFFFATRPLIAPGDSPAPGDVTQLARATPPAGQTDATAAAPEAPRVAEAPPAAGAPSGVAAAPAKGMAGNVLKDKLAATRAAGKLAEPERRLARDQRPADQAVAPAQVAEAVPAPSAVPVGQAALERKELAAAAGNVAARADADEKRTRLAAEPAALPPAPVPPPAEAQFAAKSALAQGASMGGAALLVVPAPGGEVRWRLGHGGQIWQAAGAGENWRLQVSGTAADLLAGSAPSPATCWVVGAGGTVLLTQDGERWERRPFPFPVDLVAVHATSARAATVTARDGRRFETSDAGLTWSLR